MDKALIYNQNIIQYCILATIFTLNKCVVLLEDVNHRPIVMITK